ncbi:MAG: Gfo/Idh/MocA family oxidoreductase [Caldilineaceae bacterium]
MQRPVRWGILGTGIIAHEFAKGLQALPDAQLLAVGSRTLTKAQEFAARFHASQAYGSYRELVENAEVDVVYIATPHAYHREHCLLALQADKAVLCEKPFTLNAAEAQEVITLARQKELFCMEAMWMRFMPAMVRLRELIAHEAIGKIFMVNASLGFQIPFDAQHRAYNPHLGGGALLDLGVYPLSLVSQLLGMPTSIASHAQIGATEVDEQAAIILGYADGAVATLTTSLRTYNPNNAVIMGERGQIEIHAPLYRPNGLTLTHYYAPIANGQIAKQSVAKLKSIPFVYQNYQRFRRYAARLRGDGDTRIATPYAANGYQYEASEVMRCLRAGAIESATMPLTETYQIMSLMDTIRAQWHMQYPQEIW